LLIRTERDNGDRVRLIVRDTGVGLPPQSQISLFDPFHSTKSGGMGIGLFVSASIIQRHQGRLWAESNDDGPGATFSFSIPHAAESILDAVPVLRTS
jgi:signal transduction histidine kinase